MVPNAVLAIALVVLAGLALAVQTPINAALGRGVGSTLVAAATSFGLGFLALTLISVLSGHGAAFVRLGAVPVWLLVGGALGAFYVWSVIWAIPTLGALTTISALVLGQVTAGILLDHLGLFGLTVQTISPSRIAAAGLVAAGLVLSRF